MKRILVIGAVVLAAVGAASTASAKDGSGPGRVTVDTEASEWDSDLAPDPDAGIWPIGGAGQVNGEFTTSERLGIEIGLRAQVRFIGPVDVTPDKSGKVGIYEVSTGDSGGAALWNYDWHVDLRDARGVAADTTLHDYSLHLDTGIADSLFGFDVPLDLKFGGLVPPDTVLYQSSQNPTFGNSEFDPTAAESYMFRLVLTPETFSGPPLAVEIHVDAQ